MGKLLIGLTLVVATLVVLGSLGHAGFCFGQRRFLPEREKIEAAVGKALGGGHARGWVRADGDDGLPFRTPPYASGAEFLAVHPDCCRLGPEGPSELLPVATNEARITVVVVDFKVQAIGRDGAERPITVRTNVAVTACGKAHGDLRFRRIAGLPRGGATG